GVAVWLNCKSESLEARPSRPGFRYVGGMILTPDEFWAVIGRARQRATPNSETAMLDALYRELVKLPDQELIDWYVLQDSYMDLAHTPKLFAAAVLING